MPKSRIATITVVVTLVGIGIIFVISNRVVAPTFVGPNTVSVPPRRAPMPDAEWKKLLTPLEYHVVREQGTETPFTSALDHETRPGTYYSLCGIPLFRSEQKYDSGTGWPSFWAPIDPDALTLVTDGGIFGERIEVRDAGCDGHLGHVFDDGPAPTGKRYCMNGAALRFVPDAPSN